MLATPWPIPFVDEGWRFELKWDGIRALLIADGDSVRLVSRRGNDITAVYPELVGSTLTDSTVLDGEIIALDESGRPSFQRLQGRMNLSTSALVAAARSSNPVTYVVFDVLYHHSALIAEPWQERRTRLESLPLPVAMVASDVYGTAAPLWAFVEEHDLEGIVAKRLGSRYRPGIRSPDWRKIAAFKTVRAVVAGSTSGEGGRRSSFGSLVLGLWDGPRLRFIGTVGSGFDDASLAAIRDALDELADDETEIVGDLPKGTRRVRPALVAMVQYREWTAAGRLRAPSFKGFTDDPVPAITWEAEGPPSS